MFIIECAAGFFDIITGLIDVIRESISVFTTRRQKQQLLNLLYRIAGKENEKNNIIDFNRYVNHKLIEITPDSSQSEDCTIKMLKKDLKPNASKNKIMFILGDPGSGKSTLMLHLAFWYCRYNSKEKKLNPGDRLSHFGIEYHKLRDYKSLEELKNVLENDFEALFLDGLDEFVVLQEKPAEKIIEELFGLFEKSKLNAIRKIYISSRKEPFRDNIKEKLERMNLNQYHPRVLEICPFDRKQILTLYNKRSRRFKEIKKQSAMRRYVSDNQTIFRIPLLIEYADVIMEEFSEKEAPSLGQALHAIVNDWLKREEQIWHSKQEIGQEIDTDKREAYLRDAWKLILEMCKSMAQSDTYHLCLEANEKLFKDFERGFYLSTRQLIRKTNEKEYEFIHLLFYEFFMARLLVSLESIAFEHRKKLLSDTTKNYKQFYTYWLQVLPANSFDVHMSEEPLIQKLEKSVKKEGTDDEDRIDVREQIDTMLAAECISLDEESEITVYGILWIFPLVRKLKWKSYQLSLPEIAAFMGEKSSLTLINDRVEKSSDLQSFFPCRNLDIRNNHITDLEWMKGVESFESLCLYGNRIPSLEPLTKVKISELKVSVWSGENLDEISSISDCRCSVDLPEPSDVYVKLEQLQKSRPNWRLALVPRLEDFQKCYEELPCAEPVNQILKAAFHLIIACFCTDKHFEPAAFDFGKEVGKSLYLAKRYEEALEIFQELKSVMLNSEDAEKKLRLKTEGWNGVILAKTGKYEYAVSLLKSACGRRWKEDLDDETQIMWYWLMVSMYRRNYQMDVTEYGINDKYKAMYSWGQKFLDIKEYEEAEKIFKDLYQRQSESLGELHEDTLNTQLWIGITLNNEEKYEQAEEILNDCYEKHKKSLGENHAQTLSTLHWFGKTLGDRKKYDQAEKLLSDCYERRKIVFGENHRETLITQHFLGDLLCDYRKYEEAERTLNDCFQKCRSAFGEKDSYTLSAQWWLGKTLYDVGKLEEAERMFGDCYEKRKEASGEGHGETLNTQEWFGSILYKEGKYDLAEPILQDCYEKRKTVLGENHQATLSTQWWFGMDLYELKKYEEAERIFCDCYEKRKEVLGENHEYTLATQYWYGRTLKEEKKEEEAEKILYDCYERRKEVLGESHPDTLAVKNLLTT